MKRRAGTALAVVMLGSLVGCSDSQQRKVDEKMDRANAKARELGRKTTEEARKAGDKIDAAVKGTANRQTARDAQEKLKDAGSRMSKQLDQAALQTKVKTQLANDIGLRTVRNISVDATRGGMVTLTGTVSSEARKTEAEQAVKKVSGVTSVVNQLTVAQ